MLVLLGFLQPIPATDAGTNRETRKSIRGESVERIGRCCYDVLMQIIQLFGGHQTLIDDEDAERLSPWSWQLMRSNGHQYAKRSTQANGKNITFMMHRVIMNAPPGLVVDHIDGDGLNNQKSNLRLLSHGQNLWNRRVKAEGVCWAEHHGKWRATISHSNKKYEVGFYKTRDEAVLARAYVASVIRKGIAPEAAEIDRLGLPPTIRRLMFHLPRSRWGMGR